MYNRDSKKLIRNRIEMQIVQFYNNIKEYYFKP